MVTCWVSISFSLLLCPLEIFVVQLMMDSFSDGSAQIIMRSIQSMLGMEKCVKPQDFLFLVFSVSASRLKAVTELQLRLFPLGMVCVFSRRTLRNLQSGLISSARYSWLTQGPKFGKSQTFWMMLYNFLLVGAFWEISLRLKVFYCCAIFSGSF